MGPPAFPGFSEVGFTPSRSPLLGWHHFPPGSISIHSFISISPLQLPSINLSWDSASPDLTPCFPRLSPACPCPCRACPRLLLPLQRSGAAWAPGLNVSLVLPGSVGPHRGAVLNVPCAPRPGLSRGGCVHVCVCVSVQGLAGVCRAGELLHPPALRCPSPLPLHPRPLCLPRIPCAPTLAPQGPGLWLPRATVPSPVRAGECGQH